MTFFFSAFLGFSMLVQQARSFDNKNHKGADVLTGAGASVIPTSSHRTLWNMVSLRTGTEKLHNVGPLPKLQLAEQDWNSTQHPDLLAETQVRPDLVTGPSAFSH